MASHTSLIGYSRRALHIALALTPCAKIYGTPDSLYTILLGIAIDGFTSFAKGSGYIVSSICNFTTHPSTTTMASQESEECSGPATNQQNSDARPYSEHSTSESKDKKNSEFPKRGGKESWRGSRDGRAQERRGKRAGEAGQMASQRNNGFGRVERGGDRGNTAGKDSQRASKKKEVGRAEWAYVSSHFSSIALALIDAAVSQLTEERATMSKLQSD